MRPDPKLSSNNGLNIKFILMFTIAFVVISSVVLIAGYLLLTTTGVLGQAEPTPTPVPSPTTKPGYVAIGVTPDPANPTPKPTQHPSTPEPTQTPTTPTPSPYKLTADIDQSSLGSKIYYITISAKPESDSLDTTKVRISVKYGDTTYCDDNFNDAMWRLDGEWVKNYNNNTMFDPGESIRLRISAYSLNIPLDIETNFILSFDGSPILNFPLPSMQKYSDMIGQLPDPVY